MIPQHFVLKTPIQHTAWMEYFQLIDTTPVVTDAYQDLADGTKIIGLAWNGRKLWMHRTGDALEYTVTEEYTITDGHQEQRPVFDQQAPCIHQDDLREILRVLFMFDGEPEA